MLNLNCSAENVILGSKHWLKFTKTVYHIYIYIYIYIPLKTVLAENWKILNILFSREWDVDSFKSSNQCDFMKALEDDTSKLLGDLDSNDPLALRLCRELSKTFEHYSNILNVSVKPPETKKSLVVKRLPDDKDEIEKVRFRDPSSHKYLLKIWKLRELSRMHVKRIDSDFLERILGLKWEKYGCVLTHRQGEEQVWPCHWEQGNRISSAIVCLFIVYF